MGSRRLQPRDVVGEEVDGRCTRLLQVLESGRSRGRQKSLESGEQRQVRTWGSGWRDQIWPSPETRLISGASRDQKRGV